MMDVFRNIASTLFWFIVAVVAIWVTLWLISCIIAGVKKGLKKDE